MINYMMTFLMILLNSTATTITVQQYQIRPTVYRTHIDRTKDFKNHFPLNIEERTNQENNYFDDPISYYLKVSQIYLDSAPFEWWKQQLDDNRLGQLHQLVGKFLVIVRQRDNSYCII